MATNPCFAGGFRAFSEQMRGMYRIPAIPRQGYQGRSVVKPDRGETAQRVGQRRPLIHTVPAGALHQGVADTDIQTAFSSSQAFYGNPEKRPFAGTRIPVEAVVGTRRKNPPWDER